MRCLNLSMTKPLEYSVCGQLISKDGFLHHCRTFEHHVLIFVTEGTLHITANGVAYDVKENQYIFLPAGEEHFGTTPSMGKLAYFWVHIVPDTVGPATIFPADASPAVPEEVALRATPAQAYEPTIAPLRAIVAPIPEYATLATPWRTNRLFRQLLELSMEKHDYCAEMLNYTLSLIIMELAREFTQTAQTARKEIPAAVSALCQWIKHNYYRPFSLAEPAKELGYQTSYLSKLFKASIGVSIITYTNQIRVEAAKNLLEVYGLPAKEVAYSCGFADEKYFMKVFKAMAGCTPTEYKKIFKI